MKLKSLLVAFGFLGLTMAASADPSHSLKDAATSGRVDAIHEALKAGADVNARFDAGRTALMLAATRNRGAAVEALIEAGADPYVLDSNGWDALTHAALEGHVGVVRLMLHKGFDPFKNNGITVKIINGLRNSWRREPYAYRIEEARDLIQNARTHVAAPVLRDDNADPVVIDLSGRPMSADQFKQVVTRAYRQRGWEILESEPEQITATLTKGDVEYRARVTHQPGTFVIIAFVRGYGSPRQNWLRNLKHDIEVGL